MRCRFATNKLSIDVYTSLHSKMEIYKKNVHSVRLKRTYFVIEMSLRYERSLSPEKIKGIIKCPFTYILVTRESLYYNETSFCNVRKKDQHHPRTSIVSPFIAPIISRSLSPLSLSFTLSTLLLSSKVKGKSQPLL